MLDFIRFCWSSITKRHRYRGYMLAKLGKALAGVAVPLLVGWVINSLVDGFDTSSILPWCFLAAALGAAAALLQYVATQLYTRIQLDSALNLELSAINRVQHFSQDFFSSYDPAYYHRQVNNDANAISIFFLYNGSNALVSAASLIAIFVLVLLVNVPIALLCAALTVVAALVYARLRGAVYQKDLDYKESFARYARCELSQFSQVDFIRRHVLFDRFHHMLTSNFKSVAQAGIQSNEISSRTTALNDLAVALFQAALLATGAWQVAIGAMQVGYLATVYSYFTMIVSAVQYFNEFGVEYQNTKVSYERLKKIQDTPLEPNGTQTLQNVSQIACQDLTFTYPGKCQPIIQGLSVSFAPGKLWGLAGANGCGKSTLLKLLDAEWTGLYQGNIRYGAVEQASLDHYLLRQNDIVMVEQEPPVIEDTLRANLTLLCQESPHEDELQGAIDRLGLRQYVTSCPQGLDTVLDDHAPALSGGEKQKVAIIRALMARPQAMLLDEPTSALDAASAQELGRILHEFSREHVVVVVTHDKDLLATCDEIVRLGSAA